MKVVYKNMLTCSVITSVIIILASFRLMAQDVPMLSVSQDQMI